MESMTIKIGEREIPLLLTALETLAIQEELGCTVLQIRDVVYGVEQDFENLDKTGNPVTTLKILKEPERVKKLATLIKILGNAGLEEAGQKPDLTDKWILRHMSPNPSMIMAYTLAVQAAITDQMSIESAVPEAGAVDLILQEEERKKEQGSSPTGG